MADSNKTAAELRRVCEAKALLNIWRRHRTAKGDSMLAFSEWTLNHRDIVAAELSEEMGRVLASLPAAPDQDKIDYLRSAAQTPASPVRRMKKKRGVSSDREL